MNKTDDDGGVSAVECRSSRPEDAHSIEDHSVDASELLEEHDGHRDAQRFQHRTFDEFSRLNLGILAAVLQLVIFDALEFSFDVRSSLSD